jgi:hypothetical protein
MKRTQILLTFFVLFGAARIFGQGNTAPAETWKRIESVDKEFSVALPPNAIIDAEERQYGQKFRLVAFQNGVAMELQVTKNSVKNLPKMLEQNGKNKVSVFTVGDFSIMKMESGPSSKFNSKFWITKKDTRYFLRLTAKTGQEKEVSRFLYSIRLQGKPLFVQKEKVDFPEETYSLSSLKTSPEVIEAFGRKLVKNKINVAYEISSEEDDDIEIDGLTRKLIVLERPYPNITPSFGRNGEIESFFAKLKINFLANGQIGDIVVLSTGNKEFTKACLEAAQKIRFVPAQINGKTADSVGIVDYEVQIFSFSSPGIIR